MLREVRAIPALARMRLQRLRTSREVRVGGIPALARMLHELIEDPDVRMTLGEILRYITALPRMWVELIPGGARSNYEMDLYFLLALVSSVVGLIISTELTIKANSGLVGNGESQWTLGQTLAVLLVLPNAYVVIKCALVMFRALRSSGTELSTVEVMSSIANPMVPMDSSGIEGHRDGMLRHSIGSRRVRRMSV